MKVTCASSCTNGRASWARLVTVSGGHLVVDRFGPCSPPIAPIAPRQHLARSASPVPLSLLRGAGRSISTLLDSAAHAGDVRAVDSWDARTGRWIDTQVERREDDGVVGRAMTANDRHGGRYGD